MPSDMASRVQHAIALSVQADDFEKRAGLDLLQGGNQEQAPGTDQIVGMLKAMLEEMEGDLKSAQETEAAAVASYGELSAAKAAEIAAATSAIEAKTKRSGEVAVEVVQ